MFQSSNCPFLLDSSVYNCYLHELFILQNYIFSFRKKKKKQEFAFFTRVFAQKLQEKRFMIQKNAKR